GQESSVAGERGEGTAFAREPVGGAQEEVRGTATEGGETKSSTGGKTETETREEQ
ncbi:hypothetical protein M9458_038666, partial [Cirrhinus mrigala]